MTGELREFVRQRAGARCEYCRLPDLALEPQDFHVEHVIARKHRGEEARTIWPGPAFSAISTKGPTLPASTRIRES
jgi:hypothetical protein